MSILGTAAGDAAGFAGKAGMGALGTLVNDAIGYHFWKKSKKWSDIHEPGFTREGLLNAGYSPWANAPAGAGAFAGGGSDVSPDVTRSSGGAQSGMLGLQRAQAAEQAKVADSQVRLNDAQAAAITAQSRTQRLSAPGGVHVPFGQLDSSANDVFAGRGTTVPDTLVTKPLAKDATEYGSAQAWKDYKQGTAQAAGWSSGGLPAAGLIGAAATAYKYPHTIPYALSHASAWARMLGYFGIVPALGLAGYKASRAYNAWRQEHHVPMPVRFFRPQGY